MIPNTRPKSLSIYEEALRKIPHGVNSPVRSFKHLGITPVVVKEGRGAEIFDVDHHRYIDYCGSWGALIHGHAHPFIVDVAYRQIRRGSSYGTTTEVEGLIAGKVIDLLPWIEKIRFVSSGTEATMTALRLARGYTGRELIVKFSGCYHGHADFLLVQAGSGVATMNSTSTSKGVPEDAIKHTLVCPFNDFEAVKTLFRELGDKIAAVIVEPIPANMGVVLPEEGFLQLLREVTLQSGSVLIFDEVISGFRVGLQGATGLFGITPDLTCLGKIIGGGFPAAAFGGKKEIMDHLAPLGQVYQAGTLSGNPVAMEAGLAALKLLQEPGFYEMLERKAKFLLNPLKQLIQEKGLPVSLQSIGSMFTLFFGSKKVHQFHRDLNQKLFAEFFCHMLQQGIYFSPAQYEANFISAAHTEDQLLYTREQITDFLLRL